MTSTALAMSGASPWAQMEGGGTVGLVVGDYSDLCGGLLFSLGQRMRTAPRWNSRRSIICNLLSNSKDKAFNKF